MYIYTSYDSFGDSFSDNSLYALMLAAKSGDQTKRWYCCSLHLIVIDYITVII